MSIKEDVKSLIPIVGVLLVLWLISIGFFTSIINFIIKYPLIALIVIIVVFFIIEKK